MKVLQGNFAQWQCIATVCALVKELGAAKISSNVGLLQALIEMKMTHGMISKRSRQDLVDLPTYTNSKISIALQTISFAPTAFYFGNPCAFIVVMCKGMQLSLSHGIAPASPMAISCVGMVTAGVLKDTVKALDIAEAALGICEAHDLKQIRPQVIAHTFGFIRH